MTCWADKTPSVLTKTFPHFREQKIQHTADYPFRHLVSSWEVSRIHSTFLRSPVSHPRYEDVLASADMYQLPLSAAGMNMLPVLAW